MSELAKVENFGGLALPQQTYGDMEFSEVAAAGQYLQRVQLYGGNSNQVKEGLIGIAHYGLADSKDKIIDLGTRVDCFVFLWRPKAMDFSDPNTPISVYDHNDPEFKRIQSLFGVQDSGCVFGPEFLIWLPTQRKFALFYCNNKTSQRAAVTLRGMLGRPVTFDSQLIKKPPHIWHGPVFKDCSTPFDMPDQESVDLESSRFLNPPAYVPSTPAPTTGTERAR